MRGEEGALWKGTWRARQQGNSRPPPARTLVHAERSPSLAPQRGLSSGRLAEGPCRLRASAVQEERPVPLSGGRAREGGRCSGADTRSRRRRAGPRRAGGERPPRRRCRARLRLRPRGDLHGDDGSVADDCAGLAEEPAPLGPIHGVAQRVDVVARKEALVGEGRHVSGAVGVKRGALLRACDSAVRQEAAVGSRIEGRPARVPALSRKPYSLCLRAQSRHPAISLRPVREDILVISLEVYDEGGVDSRCLSDVGRHKGSALQGGIRPRPDRVDGDKVAIGPLRLGLVAIGNAEVPGGLRHGRRLHER